MKKGQKLSEETKRKISESRKGQKQTEKWKKMMKELMKGNQYGFKKNHTPWNKGSRGIMVAWNKGKKMSEKTREKIRQAKLGKKYGIETKEKHRQHWLRENNPNYKDGKSKYIVSHYKDLRYKLWREAVFERDNWTCQECNERGGYLEPHHIKSWAQYPELRFELNNGITLCKKCHRLTDNYRHKGIKKNILKNS